MDETKGGLAAKWTCCKPQSPGGELLDAGEREVMGDLQMLITKEVLDPGSSVWAQRKALKCSVCSRVTKPQPWFRKMSVPLQPMERSSAPVEPPCTGQSEF